MITETNSEYLKMSEEKGARIEELEGQVQIARKIKAAHIQAFKTELRKAQDETEFVIGAFSSEIHKIKTELHQLRIEDDIRGIEADLVRSQARAFYILGHTEDIPWEEIENQVRLLEKLMAARQEYQQTE